MFIAVSACVSQPCLNGGTCVNVGISFQCQCSANYTGLTCSEGQHNLNAFN